MKRPNVILFTWHDAGDWFGCYGHRTVHTPHVDRLAAGGVRFTDHISACAICSPSRAAIVTGRLCQENGVMTLTNGPMENRIHPHVPHLARRLKGLGYRTALLGIQHECAHEHVEQVMAIDEQIGTDPWPHADLLAPQARGWLERQRGRETPFYLQVGTIDAHLNRFYTGAPPRSDEPYPPVQDETLGLAAPGYLAGSAEDRASVATLQGLIRRGDRLMGAILDALDATGLADDTIVAMCVDHGVGLSRAKTTCYEAGNRVAWIMRAPGRLPAGRTVDTLCGHIDVLPTLWELLGEPAIAGLDGRSLVAHARGETAAPVHPAVFSHMVEETRCIRTATHLLIRNLAPPRYHSRRADCADQWGPTKPKLPRPASGPHLELYDRRADPDCLRDLAGDAVHAGLRDRLDTELWDFLIDHDDFAIHASVRDDWQSATRDQLLAHCRRHGRRVPLADGPRHNPIDAAHARGQTP